jgi:hypothetical protein
MPMDSPYTLGNQPGMFVVAEADKSRINYADKLSLAPLIS